MSASLLGYRAKNLGVKVAMKMMSRNKPTAPSIAAGIATL
jgi:hypothetical protein